MKKAVDQFNCNIANVKALGALHDGLATRLTEPIDLSDILRSQLVLAVSSLDHFIHELVRLGMLEAFAGVRPRTDSFSAFLVSIESVLAMQSTPGDLSWLELEIRKRHSWQSFQQPEKIATALALISQKKLWNELGIKFKTSTELLQQKLKLIIDRRNKIAHEADADPTNFGVRWGIQSPSVVQTVTFLSELGNEIYSIVK